jgi:ribose transport system ATP-binding protein
VLLISSDHDELMAMSDRVAVIRHGTVAAIRSPQDLTHADLVRAATDKHRETAA